MVHRFRYATVNFFDLSLTLSDATTPMEHTSTCLHDERELNTDCSVIHVRGFHTVDDMIAYCSDRNLAIV